MRLLFLSLGALGVQIPTDNKSLPKSIAAMSIDDLTSRLIASNRELFVEPTHESTDSDLASMDRRDRNANIPRAVNITANNQDYLDGLWNWVKGVSGQVNRGILPYVLHTSKYLNEYVYQRAVDPSDSTKPNVAGDIVVDSSWDPDYPISWSLWNTSQPIPVYWESENACLSAIINEAMIRFQEVTNSCIQFVQVQSIALGVVQVSSYNDGCYATLGYRKESNILNLGQGCLNVGTAMHLLGHVLGMAHEDQRPDASKYVTVNPQNIDVYGMSSSSDVDPSTTAKFRYFFTPLNGTETQWETQIARFPYEYGSLMHNSKSVYAVDISSDRTISSIASAAFDDLMGNRGYLTQRDGRLLNEMYSCSRVPLSVLERVFSKPLYPGVTFEFLNQCAIDDAQSSKIAVSFDE